jgi:tetratricopeptide (TPR) repeat protein
MGNYLDAYTYFQEYLTIVETGGKEAELCFALLAISEALRYLKRYDEMEPYIQRSIQLCQRLNFQWALGFSLIAMGVCATEQDKLETATPYLEEGVRIARDFCAQRDLIYGLSSLGYVYYRRKNIVEAVNLLQEALGLAREAEMPYFTCYIQRNLAYVYLAQGNLDAARDALRDSLTVARHLALLPETIKALACAVAYAHTIGENVQAATWAGFLMDNPDVDLADFQPVCASLEAVLGTEIYHRMLEQGKERAMDEIGLEVLAMADVLEGKAVRIP